MYCLIESIEINTNIHVNILYMLNILRAVWYCDAFYDFI